MLNDNGHVAVHDKVHNRFFRVDSSSLPATVPWRTAKAHIPGPALAVYAILLIAGLALLLATLATNYRQSVGLVAQWPNLAILLVYLAVNLICHEGAHMLALHHCGRKVEKVGIKLNFAIFPALYVRMNGAYTLPRNDRLLIHSAGLAANVATGIATLAANQLLLHNSVLFASVNAFTYTILCNAVPILKSDGQKILFTLMGKLPPKHARDYDGVAWLFNILSWCVVAYTLLSLIRTIVSVLG